MLHTYSNIANIHKILLSAPVTELLLMQMVLKLLLGRQWLITEQCDNIRTKQPISKFWLETFLCSLKNSFLMTNFQYLIIAL